jgi:hypothetical protein
MSLWQSSHPATSFYTAGRQKRAAEGIEFCIFFRGVNHLQIPVVV